MSIGNPFTAIGNPLKQVGNLLGQFTGLQDKLSEAVVAIRTRRAARLDTIQVLQSEVTECEAVCKQAENAITGIDKLLSGN